MATVVLLAILGLFSLGDVRGARVQCDFYDSDCATRTAQAKYLEFVLGIPGVEPSDPLHQDLIVANISTVKYTIKDGTLSGFKKCYIELVRFSKDHTYDHYIRCPLLTLESEYELKGDVFKNFIEGKGTCKVEFHDYRFLFHGNYETKKRDDKTYLRFSTFTLNLDAKGKVEYNLQNLFNGDKQKSEAALKMMNENWKEVDEMLRQPTMEAFMKVYMKNVNDYLNIVSAEEILSYEQ